MCLQGTMGLKGRHTVYDHKEDFKPFLCTIIGCCCLSDRKAKKLQLKKKKKKKSNKQTPLRKMMRVPTQIQLYCQSFFTFKTSIKY